MGANVLKKQQTPKASRLKIAHNALSRRKQRVFVETANVSGDNVEVIYIDRDILDNGEFDHTDWQCCRIRLNNLVSFIQESDLGDTDTNNTHTDGGIPIAFYLEENITYAVKRYIEAGKEISHV